MMTNQEHTLMLALFSKQQQAIRILLDILSSRDVLTGDDEQAFQFALMHDPASNAQLYDECRQAYVRVASSLGVETGFEKLPPPPASWFRGSGPDDEEVK